MFNKQKIAAVSSMVMFLTFGLTNCGSSSAEADQKLNIGTALYTEKSSEPQSLVIIERKSAAKLNMLIQQAKARTKLANSTTKMQHTVKKLKKHLNSQYGRGGASPGYWDCSGLVSWFYAQQGIEIRHSATAQSHLGKKVKHPKIGDIVAFHYGSSQWSFHTGIYVGYGKVLHAYNYVSDTLISDVKDVAKENGAWVSYRRIIETN
jgi:cell wall-associated NlpC family hydrolase